MANFEPETVRDAFAKHSTIEKAAVALRVSSRTLYRWLRAHPTEIPAGVGRACAGWALGRARKRENDPGVKLKDAREIARGALAGGSTVAGAARAAGVDARTVQRWITAGL